MPARLRHRRLQHYSWPYDGVVEAIAIFALCVWTLGEFAAMVLLAIGAYT